MMAAIKTGQYSHLNYKTKGIRTHIGEPACGQGHCNGTHQGTGHDQKIGVGVFHVDTDLTDQRQDNQSSNGMGNEGGNDKNQGAEDEEHAI